MLPTSHSSPLDGHRFSCLPKPKPNKLSLSVPVICDIRIWGTVIVGCSWRCGRVMERLCQDCLATRLLILPPVSREVTQDMGKWVYGVLPTIITIKPADSTRKRKLMGITVHRGEKVVLSSFICFLYCSPSPGFPPPAVSLVIGPGIENSREWGWLQGSVRMEMKGKMKRDPVDLWTCPSLAHSRQWLQNKGTLILSRCCASLAGTRRHTYVHMYTRYCAAAGLNTAAGHRECRWQLGYRAAEEA